VPFRRSSIVLAAVGGVLIALALVVRLVVVPIATRLPDDTDLTAQYAGSASLLDSEALQSGDLSNAVQSDVPITVDRRVQVLSTHGTTAIVRDALTIEAGDQTLVSSHDFALDRSSLEGVSGPDDIPVEPAEGALSSAFPIGPEADDSYRYYDPTTQSVVPIDYSGTDEREGRSVYVYDISATGPVKDPGLLAMLPPALPKSLLPGLAEILPASVLSELTPEVVAALPDPVPVAYTGTTNLVVYVDQQTGVAVDQRISQQVVVSATLGSSSVSLLPVLSLDFEITPDSVSDLADKAASAGLLLTIISVVVPIGLAVIGLGLVVVAVIRRKKPLPPPAGDAINDATGSTEASRDVVPTGVMRIDASPRLFTPEVAPVASWCGRQ
jgi:Porin PorA